MMKNRTNFLIALLFLLPFLGAKASELKSYEMPRTQVVPIKDSAADKQYELYIKLPEDYAENTDKTYPVIYTTDAVWHMDLLSGSTEYLMPDAILVGISWQKDGNDERAHASRFRDYTLFESSYAERQARYRFGQGAKHLSFIRDRVIKHVESNYRTAPGQRAYLGYSLGGSFGAYILFAAPDTFNHYILGSPAFGERSFKIVDELEAETASQQKGINVNVFLSIGELETDQMDLTNSFVSVLERRSQVGLAFTGLEVIAEADHTSAVPMTFARSIKWLSQLAAE